jgi:hypothetical protein
MKHRPLVTVQAFLALPELEGERIELIGVAATFEGI